MDYSDDEIRIVEIRSPNLLVEKGEPLKIYLEGFLAQESLELMGTVKKYGGEVSNYAGPRIITLARPEHPALTKFDRFHVDWLYHTIKFTRIQNLPEYKMMNTDPIVKVEISEKEDHLADEGIGTELEAVNDIPTPRSADTSDNNSSYEFRYSDAQKLRLECKQQSDSSSTEKRQLRSSGRNMYTPEKERAMVKYLIDEKAISQSNRKIIWEKMLKKKLIEGHTAASMTAHFLQYTLHRVHLYTEDKKALKEFDEIQKKKQKKFLERYEI